MTYQTHIAASRITHSNWRHKLRQQFQNCFFSAKTKRPVVKYFSCFSQSLSVYAVWAPNQRRSGVERWRMRDVVVVSAG